MAILLSMNGESVSLPMFI